MAPVITWSLQQRGGGRAGMAAGLLARCSGELAERPRDAPERGLLRHQGARCGDGERRSGRAGARRRRIASRPAGSRCRAAAKCLVAAEDAAQLAAADEAFMRLALEQAEQGGAAGEVPVGAVVVLEGRVVCAARNEMEASGDATRHAELAAVRAAAAALGRFRLAEATLYVTLEPCAMCAGALLQARLRRVVYGARNGLLGADGSWVQLLRRGRRSSACRCSRCRPQLAADFTDDPTNERPHAFHPDIEVRGGVLAEESAALMQSFFRLRRLERELLRAAAAQPG